MKKSGIYQIRHIFTGKRYVGSAVHFKRRYHLHLTHLRQGKHHSQHLQRVCNKYGYNSLIFELLEKVESPSDLKGREQFYLDTLKPEFNGSPTAGGIVGLKRPPEFGRAISERMKGRKLSEETKEKLRDANLGKTYSEETRQKKREKMTGRKHSEVSKEKLRQSAIERGAKPPPYERKGRKQSPESIQKRAEALKGRKYGDEYRHKASETAKRREETKRANGTNKQSPESVAKRANAIRGRKYGEAFRAKCSEAAKKREAAKRASKGRNQLPLYPEDEPPAPPPSAVGKENKLVTSLINRLSGAQQAATASTGKLTVAQRLFNLVARANPIGLIVTALALLIGLVAVLANNWDAIRTKFAPVVDFIEEKFNLIKDKVRDVLSLISGGLIDDAATAKTKDNVLKSIEAFERLKVARERQIAILEAEGGQEEKVYRLKEQLLLKEIQGYNQKRAAKIKLNQEELAAEQDLLKDLAILRINEQKRLEADAKKAAEEAKRRAAEALKLLEEQKKRFDNVKESGLSLTLAQSIGRERALQLKAEQAINAELAKGGNANVAILETNRQILDDTKARIEALKELAGQGLIPKIDASQVKPVPVDVTPSLDSRGFGEKVADFFQQEAGQAFKQGLGDMVLAGADLAATLFDNAIARMEGGLEHLREGIALTEQQIQQSGARSEELENQLAGSRGQRREFLLAQIEQERQREAALEKQKERQAKEEKRRMDDIEKKRKQAAALQKVIDIGQAVSRTALAVISALGPPPTGLGPVAGIPFSLAAGATGALQIATIAAQKYAEGGLLGLLASPFKWAAKKLFSRGEVLQGPSHAQGGIPFTIAGVPGFEAEGGEVLVNKRSAALFRKELSAINSYMGYGKKFAEGGIVSPAPAPIFNTVNLANDALVAEMRATREAILNMPAPRVGVDQITSAKQRNAEIESKGTI